MYSSADKDDIMAEGKQGKECRGRHLSEAGAAVNMLKFLIGLGMISLPNATAQIGWLPSLIGMAILGLITVWGIFFAFQAKERMDKLEEVARDEYTTRGMSEGDPLMNTQSYKDLPSFGCGFFDQLVGKTLGRSAQYLFAASIAIGQFTTMVCYVNVISENFESYFTQGPSHITVLIVLGILLAAFALIPNLQGVSYLSAAGLVTFLFLFIGLIAEVTRKAVAGTLPASGLMIRSSDVSNYGQWFGAVCFAFSGFPIAIAVHAEMKNPHFFHTLVTGCYSACWVAYSLFAVLGFICYGAETNTLVYFNFEAGSVWRLGSAAVLACILCLSFMVQAMPVFIFADAAWNRLGFGKHLALEGGMPQHVLRWTVIACCILVAYFVPSVKAMMNTLGAVSGVLAGFIFPSVVYLRVSARDEWLCRIRGLLVITIGVMGAYYSCAGTMKPGQSPIT